MKNYVIFKGINSNSFKNLIIMELPPITKPKMRVATTEIDGKDGDIVDEYGYSSYDKTLKIGLINSNNIDEIIKYFNGIGDIVFSNEPDKFYKAHIYSSVDYERLLKFKTAIIKIHVQPFKYLLNESSKEFLITNNSNITIKNAGLEASKPKITLYGTGNVIISINGIKSFSINIDDEYVIIDSAIEEAYKESILKNRNMVGEFPMLMPGDNTISWIGNLTKIIIKPNSRWL